MVQIVEMTYQEKHDMYMKCKKSELAEMLIECNKQLDGVIRSKGEDVKQKIISGIKQRILDEQRKHKSLDWAEIAARKIYSSYVGASTFSYSSRRVRVSLKKACEMYDVTPPTFRRWKTQGLINYYHLGSKVFIDVDEFESAMQQEGSV